MSQSTGNPRKLALAWSATEALPMLKVAFATDDRFSVNQHFGASLGFAVYALDADKARLVGVSEFAAEDMDGNENKLAAKIAALDGCAAVYCLAVGGSAVRQLLARDIQPVRLESAEPIDKLLGQLQRAIREGGVPWLDKAVKKLAGGKEDGRFDSMLAEGWDE